MRSLTLSSATFSSGAHPRLDGTRRGGIKPQMHRGAWKYAGMRRSANVLLRDGQHPSLIIDEMLPRDNVIYADFTDYDELAHHCGPERVESVRGPRTVSTRRSPRMIKATDEAPRPYKFIVLSTRAEPRGDLPPGYGVSLGEYVRSLMMRSCDA